MNYDAAIHLNADGRGEFVSSWLREEGKAPILVQVWRSHIQDHWGKDWQDGESIKSEFRRRRSELIEQAKREAITDDAGVLVFNVK